MNELQTTVSVSLQVAAEAVLELLPDSPERELALLHLREAAKVITAGVKRQYKV